MKIIKILFSIIYLSFFTNGCDPVDLRLKIHNLTDKVIFFRTEYDTILTSTDYNDEIGYAHPSFQVDPWELRSKLCPGPRCWEGKIYSSRDSTLRLFIFYEDTLRKYYWKEVMEKGKYAARYDLTLKDLEKMNWTVVFPPDSANVASKQNIIPI